MKLISGGVVGSTTIWVRSNEENPNTFVYRGVQSGSMPLQCYSPIAQQDSRNNWMIVSTSQQALPPCANRMAPPDSGTLYTISRNGQ